MDAHSNLISALVEALVDVSCYLHCLDFVSCPRRAGNRFDSFRLVGTRRLDEILERVAFPDFFDRTLPLLSSLGSRVFRLLADPANAKNRRLCDRPGAYFHQSIIHLNRH